MAKIKREGFDKTYFHLVVETVYKLCFIDFIFTNIQSFLFLIKYGFSHNLFKNRRNIVSHDRFFNLKKHKKCELSKRKENRVLRL